MQEGVVIEVDTALGPLAVELVGQGEPVVFWHSLFVDRRSWRPQCEALAGRFRLVLIDGPGHGQSGHPNRTYTLDECADAAVSVMDRLDLASVPYVGSAWGGHVGVTLCARHPGRVSSLAVLGAPMQTLNALERFRGIVLTVALRLLGAKPFLVRAAAAVLVAPNARMQAKAYVEECLTQSDRQGLFLAMRSIMLGRPSLIELLSTIRAAGTPCLFATGDQDALWAPPLAAEHAELAGADFHVFKGVAHLASIEAPKEVNALLSDWLSGRP